MRHVGKKVEIFANIATILVAGLAIIIFLRREFPSGSQPREIQTGQKMHLDGVNWKKSGETLVLALQKDCVYCEQGASFYKRLAQALNRKGDQVIALLPQAVNESNEYLRHLGVTADEIKESSLHEFGILYTPTLLRVNESGTVVDIWKGKLTAAGEAEVLTRFGVGSGNVEPCDSCGGGNDTSQQATTEK